MSTALSIPQGFGPLPSAFADGASDNSELGQGVSASYAVVGYRGKVWSLKFSGEEQPLMREDGDGPRNSIEVVLVKASPAISKIFYANGWVDGSNAAPDCWSGNGITPDASVQNKQHATCADCPMNAWGSRITEAGKQGKSCADSRRMAVVPIADMANEAYGGPMLLRVPAASLKDLKAYGDMLASYQFPYYASVTRISFDATESFPKFVFSAVRALTNEEAAFVRELRDDRRVGVVLAEKADAAAPAAGAAAPVASSPFEQQAAAPAEAPKPAPAPKAAAPKPAAAAAKPAAAAAPKPAAQATTASPAAAAAVESPAAKAARLKAELLRAELAALEAETAAAGATDEPELPLVAAQESDGSMAHADFDAALEGLLASET